MEERSAQGGVGKGRELEEAFLENRNHLIDNSV